MKSKTLRPMVMICLLALVINSANVAAREKQDEPLQKPSDEQVALTDYTFKLLSPTVIVDKTVKGAPYSATATTEHSQTLSDGNQIIRKNESKIYRDSEGRTRTEQKLGTIGKWAAAGEPQEIIYINDPVAGFSYVLDTRTQVVRKRAFVDRNISAIDKNISVKIATEERQKTEIERLEKAKANLTKELEKQSKFSEKLNKENEKLGKEKEKLQEERMKLKEGPPSEFGRPKIAPAKPAAPAFPAAKSFPALPKVATVVDERVKVEMLGTQLMEGVQAEGKRATRTIPAGSIGNVRDIEIIDESWYSPELQVQVMTRHSDPRSGETTYRLTNINRSEPGPSLFEVPPNYTVDDRAMPKGKRPTKPEADSKKP